MLAALGLVAFAWQELAGGRFAHHGQRSRPRPKPKRKRTEAKQKEQEADPQVERLVIQPGDPKSESQALKPGHWATGSQRMRAIYQDFVGQSERRPSSNAQAQPYPVDGTPLVLESTRPVALAKGQPKEIDTTFLAPQVAAADAGPQRAGRARFRPIAANAGAGDADAVVPILLRRAGEGAESLHASENARLGRRCRGTARSESDDTEDPLHYRVVSLPVDRTIPLSDNPLTWTSIAYVLWDEVDPKLFTPEQERALVDWLHWGGQLVVSGPDSLDLLKGSFLEPYLPATSGGSRTDRGGRSRGAERPLADAARGAPASGLCRRRPGRASSW